MFNIGKIKNGALFSPTNSECEKIIVSNPSTEQIKYLLGYKDIIYSEKPEFDPVCEYLNEIYTETEDSIIVDFEVKGYVM